MNEDLNVLTTNNPKMVGNRYIIEKELGRGGIGVVFKAKDSRTNNHVVIKVLHDFLAGDPWIAGKFTKEAKAIVEKLRDVEGVVEGIEEGLLPSGASYLVMEYIEGKDLRGVVKTNPTGIDLERSANILRQLGETLTKIHNNGIYHRDLKPDNVMLTIKNGEEKIKVIDFGIATVKESPEEKTKSTIMAGTPVYMAPEQLMGKPVDKSDIYAMGIIAYEMLTGRIPFNISGFPAAIAPAKLYEMQQAGSVISPKHLRPDLPNEADKLILKAISFNSQDRFAAAQEFGILLAKALLNEESIVPPTRVVERIIVQQPVKSGNQAYLMIIGLVIVLAIIGIIAKVANLTNNASLTAAPVPKPSTVGSSTITSKFSFSLTLEEFRKGKYQTPAIIVGEKLIFHDKDRMRFNILGQKEGYIYMLNESPKPLIDGSPKYFLIFPTANEANSFIANQEITIPKKEDIGFEFTGSTGTERIWIVFSEKQIPELETAKPLPNKKVLDEIKDPTHAKAIKQLLDKYQVSKLEENKTAKKMEASTSVNSMAVLVELEHR